MYNVNQLTLVGNQQPAIIQHGSAPELSEVF